MWRNCSPSEACTPITSRCGDLVQRYAPEVNRRLRSRLKPTNDSWRVDSDLQPGVRLILVYIARR